MAAAFRAIAGEAAKRAARFVPSRMRIVAGPAYATISRRFAAYLLDGLLVIPLSALAWTLLFVLPGGWGVAAAAAAQFLPLAYLWVMHARGGQTVGKHIAGVRVTGLEATLPPGWRASLLRAIGALGVSALLLGAGVGARHSGMAAGAMLAGAFGVAAQLWVLVDCGSAAWDPRRRALHDRLAGTVVVRVDDTQSPIMRGRSVHSP